MYPPAFSPTTASVVILGSLVCVRFFARPVLRLEFIGQPLIARRSSGTNPSLPSSLCYFTNSHTHPYTHTLSLAHARTHSLSLPFCVSALAFNFELTHSHTRTFRYNEFLLLRFRKIFE